MTIFSLVDFVLVQHQILQSWMIFRCFHDSQCHISNQMILLSSFFTFLYFYFGFCFVGFLFVSIPPPFCAFSMSVDYRYRTSPLLLPQILIYLLGFVIRVPCSTLSVKTNCSGGSERLSYSFFCCYKTGSKCLVTFSWLTWEMQYL